MRSYAETVDYLFGLLPMYQRTGALPGKLDLSKTEALLEALGNPHRRLSVVHVGGTNGKGSVSHAVASLCTAAGQRVGLYTSPHYVDYRERVRIDGQLVPESFVVDFVAQHEALIRRTRASFFEFTVAMAFAYFESEGVDLAVVEVGLGGRLDSTNVVTPLVSVITNVDLDHTEVLGETRALIAREKAGIIKPECPVVIGRFQEETWPVFREVAAARRAPVFKSWHFPNARLESLNWDVLGLRGPFARENARTALATYEVLRKRYPLPPVRAEVLADMTALSGYGGRFAERVASLGEGGGAVTVIADAGHNEAAWEVTVPAVVKRADGRGLRVVCGFVKGKDPVAFARLWPEGTMLYVGDVEVPRNMPSSETVARLAEAGIAAESAASIAEAYDAALASAPEDGIVFVGGSSYVVGAYLSRVER